MPALTLPQLRRLLWISGRSSRLEWWCVHACCAVAIAINDQLLLEPARPTIAGIAIQRPLLFWLCINIALLWVSVTSIVRRLHDRNKSAWWALLYPWPVIGWAWFFIECGFLAGRAPPPEPTAPTGLVQRTPRRPWTLRRIARMAGNAVGLTLIALVLYKWFFDAPTTLPVFRSELQQPAKPELVE